MELWRQWWPWVKELRPACARTRTFMWMLVVLMGFCIREDLLGVTSFVRVLGLMPECYDRLLDFFHSSSLCIDKLAGCWTRLVISRHPKLVKSEERLVLVADGIKVAKSGKKMPAVKRLHQESESNTKPEYIMGHSIQAISVLATWGQSVVAIPLIARIHEGLKFTNRDKRTLPDKMNSMLNALPIEQPFYLVADAYYACAKVADGICGGHLITRVKTNVVGYEPPVRESKSKQGRPRIYGNKVKLWSLFEEPHAMFQVPSPLYGETKTMINIRVLDLLWKPVRRLVRFVLVDHPTRGRRILMCTDLELPAEEIVRLYGYRFKIELTFKHALHVLGAFLYHFWMAPMTTLKRNAGNQHLHRKTEEYRAAVRRKMDAYHRFIQLGLIAQGLLQILATTVPETVWSSFGSWLRTIRPELSPSELVVSIALRNTLPGFLAGKRDAPELRKFLCERIDVDRAEGLRLVS